MYDITKTRMLLTTSVFAAVAALCAVRGEREDSRQDSGSASGSAGVAPDRRATPPSRRAGGARAARARRPGRAANPLQQTRVTLSGSTYLDGWLAGLLASAAGATTALQQTGVTRSGPAAELTRPCSPQGSMARCRGGIALP